MRNNRDEGPAGRAPPLVFDLCDRPLLPPVHGGRRDEALGWDKGGTVPGIRLSPEGAAETVGAGEEELVSQLKMRIRN